MHALFRTTAGVLLAMAMAACTAANGEPAADDGGDAPQEVVLLQGGAPGEQPQQLTAEEVAALPTPAYTLRDVAFMQGMYHHHAQALDMTALVPERSSNDQVPLFAERMDISQRDEMAMIVGWLEARGEEVPDVGAGSAHAAGEHGMHMMPGMLTPQEMAELEAAEGVAFDILFLDYMTRHHEGALQMVEDLLAVDDGSGQDNEIFVFATHVNGDQLIELDRMALLRAALVEG